jgi:starch phosphorylase
MAITVPELSGVQLSVPPEFSNLYNIGTNLWWAWDDEAQDLFSMIDGPNWSSLRNPIPLLQGTDLSRWEALAADPRFADTYQAVVRRFEQYMTSDETWFQNQGVNGDMRLAYLCAEFGLHFKFNFYSGGLGVLAGDHLKTASDLGLPMVAVGVLYRRGYFRQQVDLDGDQEHYYPPTDMGRRPIHPVRGPGGGQLVVDLDFPGRTVHVAAWKLQVGRVPLILLDTDLPSNDPADRPITHLLYVRGRDMRLAQELVLGVGAVKVLRALNLEPTVWHVNEGHAAFSLLERANRMLESGAAMGEVIERIKANTLFTLHTPVPAGNEKFQFPAVKRYSDYLFPRIDSETVRELGRSGDHDNGMFDLGATAIRFASYVNGVSQRHAKVATHEWSHLIGHEAAGITNGVHVPTWAGPSVRRLFADAVGPDWREQLTDSSAWKKLLELPNSDVWQAHQSQKLAMVKAVRRRLSAQVARHGAGPDRLREIETDLPPARLTVGFARRFATYKRATLILSDLPRLQALLTHPERPVQLLFAGKAHPADEPGQSLIRRVMELAQWPEFRGYIFFVEDYNMQLGRLLTGGCDVWLNTPVPPKEASGTSGMKAALNGVPNLSVPDGWWGEAARHGENGWVFGPPDLDARPDHDDAAELYSVLENAVVPVFYERDEDDIPVGWVEIMKRAMADMAQPFSSHRMMMDYCRQAYFPLGAKASQAPA